MVQKITCPECNAELDLDEVHKEHLKNLEAKTIAEAEKKGKDSAQKEIQETKKKAVEWAKEKIKVEQEKKDDVMDDDAGLQPGMAVGTNIPEPEAPPAGNGAAMPGQEPTAPGGVEGQAGADQEYSGPEAA